MPLTTPSVRGASRSCTSYQTFPCRTVRLTKQPGATPSTAVKVSVYSVCVPLHTWRPVRGEHSTRLRLTSSGEDFNVALGAEDSQIISEGRLGLGLPHHPTYFSPTPPVSFSSFFLSATLNMASFRIAKAHGGGVPHDTTEQCAQGDQNLLSERRNAWLRLLLHKASPRHVTARCSTLHRFQQKTNSRALKRIFWGESQNGIKARQSTTPWNLLTCG